MVVPSYSFSFLFSYSFLFALSSSYLPRIFLVSSPYLPHIFALSSTNLPVVFPVSLRYLLFFAYCQPSFHRRCHLLHVIARPVLTLAVAIRDPQRPRKTSERFRASGGRIPTVSLLTGLGMTGFQPVKKYMLSPCKSNRGIAYQKINEEIRCSQPI